MHDIPPPPLHDDASKHEPATCRPARWLHFAATPIFAVMALVTAFTGSGMDAMAHSAMHASTWNGMLVMYILMAVLHAAPWLELRAKRRGAAHAAADGRGRQHATRYNRAPRFRFHPCQTKPSRRSSRVRIMPT